MFFSQICGSYLKFRHAAYSSHSPSWGRTVTSSLVSIVRRPCFWLLKDEKRNCFLSPLTTTGFKNEAVIKRYVWISHWNVRRDVFEVPLLNVQPDSVSADQTSHLQLLLYSGVRVFIYLFNYLGIIQFIRDGGI